MEAIELRTLLDATSVQLVSDEVNHNVIETEKVDIDEEAEPELDENETPSKDESEEPSQVEEEEVDLIEKKLKPPDGKGRKAYYVTDDDNHDIYEKLENGEVGECVGKLVGKALRTHFFN
jgi:hypothetical protein